METVLQQAPGSQFQALRSKFQAARAVSTELEAGLELRSSEIMT